ncbi:hypothetical protein BDZ94DRAFT_239446 [Collybia nuda]|uniref:Uncharacterized protein n=1 Tax=Collybia nuda TaxID=64659 RepID=A0A9P5YC96_9AGAR|nr:hypothetical protein BDZ94DRAFT_239446 [Collybia nuda]
MECDSESGRSPLINRRVNKHQHSYPLALIVIISLQVCHSLDTFQQQPANVSVSPFTTFPHLHPMQHYDNENDLFASNSHFLSPSSSSPRKSPTRQNINNRRSNSSLRGPSLAHVVDDDQANGRHSLAHELAVALMPEPSAGSKLLAEEFGIEYDEGAEGIDEQDHRDQKVQISVDDSDVRALSFADEISASTQTPPFHTGVPLEDGDAPPYFDPVFGSPSVSKAQKRQKKSEQDAMELLAQDLASTDKFLTHLRHLDSDPAGQQPALERIATDVIRRINETTRDREGQVRELLEYEREFRKIAGEIGGSDVLGHLDELIHINDLLEDKPPSQDAPRPDPRIQLDSVEEEIDSPHPLNSHDWETDPDRHHLGDEDEDLEPIASPIKDSFPAPPAVAGPTTPAKTIPQLAHLRTFTTSLVSSLTTISEQAQVNGAATTEAGRKIRALKNKLGGWRTDWDSAERSRLRIDRWEAGIIDGEMDGNIPISPSRSVAVKRVDGRRVVEEQLHAFELALADAAMKTQAIMAS